MQNTSNECNTSKECKIHQMNAKYIKGMENMSNECKIHQRNAKYFK